MSCSRVLRLPPLCSSSNSSGESKPGSVDTVLDCEAMLAVVSFSWQNNLSVPLQNDTPQKQIREKNANKEGESDALGWTRILWGEEKQTRSSSDSKVVGKCHVQYFALVLHYLLRASSFPKRWCLPPAKIWAKDRKGLEEESNYSRDIKLFRPMPILGKDNNFASSRWPDRSSRRQHT